VATDGSQAIYLNCATNSNQKIFPITAVDDGADLVQTTGTPTGCTASSSDWGIGGRRIWNPALLEAGMRAGDTIQFNNSPASSASSMYTARVAGDAANGPITIRGKTGVRPVLTVTGNVVLINANGFANYRIENLELDSDSTNQNVITSNSNWYIINVKIVDGGGSGIQHSSTGFLLVTQSDISGTTGDCINATVLGHIIGNTLHGCGGDGLETSHTTPSGQIVSNVIYNNTGRGVYISGAAANNNNATFLYGNTIYGNSNSGVELLNANSNIIAINNIFSQNGNEANEYNVEYLAGNELNSTHRNNIFYHSNCQGSGTGGPACVLGLTLHSSESSSDPLFTNAGTDDFTLQSGSPGKATGYPGTLLGAGGTIGYMDMGALQRQEAGGASGGACIGC
jgi:hypothetical protein